MSISLIGIILVQILWIKNAIEIHEKQFDRQVNIAMQNAVDKLDRKATILFVEGNTPNVFADSLYVESDGNTLKVQIKDSSAKSHIVMKQKDVHVQNNIELVSDSIYCIKMDSGNVTTETEHNILITAGDNEEIVTIDAKKIKHKVKRFNNVVTEWIIETEASKDPIAARINTSNINEILQKEFANSSLIIGFDYAIIDNKKDIITKYKSANFDSVNIATKYKVNLFPDDIVEKSATLAVNIHNRQGEILKSIGLLLLGSLIFTLGIVSTFAITLFTILKQKKISSIKTDFINNMTHEFKTPIATISLAADSIANKKVIDEPEKIKYFTNIIKQENKRMNTQVEHVLQMALLDSRSFKLNLQKQDIHILIRKASESIKLPLQRKQGVIALNLDAENSICNVDEVHFSNVIFNLLDNAIKYSENIPEITITTKNTKSGVSIAILDNGIGMSKDVKSKIFEKFYRISTGNVHNIKGFGLGLSYVKAIVLASNGTIDVESELGKGSAFKIFLPNK